MSITENPPKALFFDVFGTVVDWRSSVTDQLVERAATALAAPTTSYPPALRQRAGSLTPTDWGAFAQEWRHEYLVFTASYDPDRQPPQRFVSVDEHHLDSLRRLVAAWGLDGLWTNDELADISRVWHRLRPWPDSPAGIRALSRQFATCTLSNGNTTLLADLASFADLPWTRILSAEDFAAYKPHPRVYVGAADRLGLTPHECALVAAHLADLNAARRCGFRTVYVERPCEDHETPEKKTRELDASWLDMVVTLEEDGFLEVARRFGIQ